MCRTYKAGLHLQSSETLVSYSITLRHNSRWSEDGGSVDLKNVGILPQHYIAS